MILLPMVAGPGSDYCVVCGQLKPVCCSDMCLNGSFYNPRCRDCCRCVDIVPWRGGVCIYEESI